MGTVLEHRFTTRGAARTVFSSRQPQVLMAGPAGTGKSRACMEKLHMAALMNPGMAGLIVRKTATSLTSTALKTWKRFVVAEAMVSGDVEFYGGSAQEPPQYRYSNGSSIAIGGMDKAMKIMSSEYDMVYVQEATELTLDDWEALTTRLRNGVMSFQQLLADCNPDTPYHWLHMLCGEGKTKMLESRHEDNPVLFTEDGVLTVRGVEYMKILDDLTGVRLQRLRHGKWVAADGLIYEDYNTAFHLLDQFEIPEDWTRYWVIDFGFRNPFVCQWWAEDPDGRLYLYREIYMTGRLVEDHARDILAQVTDDDGDWTEPRPSKVITDHDAEGRATLETHLGMSTEAANKTVTEGIQATQARYKIQPDGKPRIFFLRDAVVERDQVLVDAKKPTSTVEEEVGYIWAKGKKPDRPEEEVPLKKDDHGQDCKRYLVADRDLQGEYNVRWL